MNHQRFLQLKLWVSENLQDKRTSLTKLAGDASFRCYYRCTTPKQSVVVMDAPPDKEKVHSFVEIARGFAQHQINVPHIIAYDLAQGFAILTDFGDDLYCSILTSSNADHLYQRAFQELRCIQRCQTLDNWRLPLFDAKEIKREFTLFNEWYLRSYHKWTDTHGDQAILAKTYEILLANASEQPHVCMHRDFHSRNLLLVSSEKVGVLDFQDACFGPITYDLVSLLRDAYIDWPEERVHSWVLAYYHQACNEGLLTAVSREQFIRWFDLMGMQRHIKILGIFARLHLRDGKSMYLAEFPRLLNYLHRISGRYPELRFFHQFIQRVRDQHE